MPVVCASARLQQVLSISDASAAVCLEARPMESQQLENVAKAAVELPRMSRSQIQHEIRVLIIQSFKSGFGAWLAGMVHCDFLIDEMGQPPCVF